ncbi:hypothetical protein FDECE_514 [Fusarium decemcellulare]|nr:hypothetical protein FDECE_514 [Fusarium decemcellulare]
MAPPVPVLWDSEGYIIASFMCCDNTACIVCLNPETFEIQATYPGPEEPPSELDIVSMVYMRILGGYFTAITANRHIIDVELIIKGGKTSFIKWCDVDLSIVTQEDSKIVGTASDAEGSLSFRTGGFVGAGVTTSDTVVVENVDKKDTVLPRTQTYSAVRGNFYNGVPVHTMRGSPLGDGTDLNPSVITGAFNNISQMAPGLVRIDLNDKTGKCTNRWYNRDIRGTVTPVLSTKMVVLYMPV